MARDFNFVFSNVQRERFREGGLVHEWRDRYPLLFDDDDQRVLRTEHQRQYNFHEWLAAVLLFEATGYKSLVAKYTAKSHPTKNALLRSCLPVKLADWVFEHESGQPDLFVYSANLEEWFFCEVKGPGDRMRANQIAWRSEFEELVSEHGGKSSVCYGIFTLAGVDA